MAPRSKHQLVSSDLTCRLQQGEWQVGDKFPTVDEFLDQYAFSRCTIFKGIQQLINDGYLNVVKGVGTFVASTHPSYRIGLVVNELGLRPQQSTYAYTLCEKAVRQLNEQQVTVTRFLEEKGNEYGTNATSFLQDSLRQRLLHGLIMTNCNLPFFLEELDAWRQSSIPYVTIAGCAENNLGVDFDYSSFCDLALDYFRKNGRRKFAMVAPQPIIELCRQKLNKYDHLELGVACQLAINEDTDPEQEGFRIMQQIWSGGEQPDAVLVADDIVCKGVAQAVQTLSINVPDELLILHSANSDAGVFYPFPMPRIEYNLEDAVSEGIQLLLSAIKRPELSGQRIRKRIVPQLIEES